MSSHDNWVFKLMISSTICLLLFFSHEADSQSINDSDELGNFPFWNILFNNQDVDRRSWRGTSLGSEFVGKRSGGGIKRVPGSEFLGKRVPGSEFIGKRVPGSEFIGKKSVPEWRVSQKRVPGSEFIGKRVPGSEFLGKRVPGSEFLGKRVPGSEFLGKRYYYPAEADLNKRTKEFPTEMQSDRNNSPFKKLNDKLLRSFHN